MNSSHTTEVMAILCDFLPILANISLSWQRLLDLCNQRMVFGLANRTKKFVNNSYTSEVMSIRRFVTSFALRE